MWHRLKHVRCSLVDRSWLCCKLDLYRTTDLKTVIFASNTGCCVYFLINFIEEVLQTTCSQRFIPFVFCPGRRPSWDHVITHKDTWDHVITWGHEIMWSYTSWDHVITHKAVRSHTKLRNQGSGGNQNEKACNEVFRHKLQLQLIRRLPNNSSSFCQTGTKIDNFSTQWWPFLLSRFRW